MVLKNSSWRLGFILHWYVALLSACLSDSRSRGRAPHQSTLDSEHSCDARNFRLSRRLYSSSALLLFGQRMEEGRQPNTSSARRADSGCWLGTLYCVCPGGIVLLATKMGSGLWT